MNNTPMKTGIELIAAERTRQIEDKKWSAEHDDAHQKGQLVDAGLCYIYAAINADHPAMDTPPPEWPWEAESWKPPADTIRSLTQAGALIAAEIDRLSRMSTQP